jgi:hypothetical protein
VDFDAGEDLVWSLKGPDGGTRTVTASDSSPRCAAPGGGCAASIFGPKKYVRKQGPKTVYTETVTVPTWVVSPYKIRIQNGEPDGRNRVSSAWVVVNGVEVASPSDFNPHVDSLERTMTLTPSTTLEVTLASAPCSFLVISFCGESGDRTPPEVTWTAPPNDTVLADATPSLAVLYQDLPGSGEPGVSGVSAETLRVLLDDVDRTSLFTRRAGDATAELPETLALAEAGTSWRRASRTGPATRARGRRGSAST